jgi:hypothetical protein
MMPSRSKTSPRVNAGFRCDDLLVVMKRDIQSLIALRGTLRYLVSGPVRGEQVLIIAIARRVEKMLPEDEFEVSTDGKVVRISGVGEFQGKTNILMPFFIWRAPLPEVQRLEMIFGSIGRRLQSFLTKVRGKPWPSIGAETHYTVDDELISLWWGGPTEAEAVVRFRPIFRKDLSA